MNLSIRYFDDEVVVTSIDAALEFIGGIQGFNMTPQFVSDFRDYAEGTVPYPKRYKVRARAYFIVIKTTATTLAEFKAHGKVALEVYPDENADRSLAELTPKMLAHLRLNDECPGWYEGSMTFKRVVTVPETGKFDYKDTSFSALVKAYSAQDCYNRMVDYLRSNEEIDPRSQFPSPKGKNYHYTYIGLKPLSELNV